ncbi:unnamed protein product [Phyllotreta striolata]|uniref:Uncharacterized protein n=1 Tax=Phyllotreta striolata TaxID=444603 RepID=A0A9N9TEH5_PHYSR|nr:unnamed protein product [Phyllotreta striolata]
MWKCGGLISFHLLVVLVQGNVAQDFRLDSHLADRSLFYLAKNSFVGRSEGDITIKNCSIETIAPEAFKNVRVNRINITGNPLSVLRRRIFSFVVVDEIYFDGNNISEIETGTFHYIYPVKEESLQILSLSHNKLRKIKRGVFSGTNFKKLMLSYNEIYYIQYAAFENMPYLLSLSLAHNKLQSIDSGIFNNFLNPTMLSVSDNKLNYIHPVAFENSTFLSLDLQRNNLSDIKKEYFANTFIGCRQEPRTNGIREKKITNAGYREARDAMRRAPDPDSMQINGK